MEGAEIKIGQVLQRGLLQGLGLSEGMEMCRGRLVEHRTLRRLGEC